MLLAGAIMSHFGVFSSLAATLTAPEWLPPLIWYILAVLPVATVILADAFRAWASGDFMNEFTLMLLASVGAYALGEYPEGVAVLLFYSFGEKMEDNASDKVKERIRSLLGRLPSRASVVQRDGTIADMDPKEVAPGSIIVVKPGAKVPIDGTLETEGEVEFDTSAITGESVPRGFASGSEIASGMIPVDREVRLRTLRDFSDSSMSRILQMIESASADKSPTETMLRRITRRYTPLVMTLALLLLLVPLIVSLIAGTHFEWMTWLNRSLVFLVCSCPCALVVGIPLAYFAALGDASRIGLLFKGSRYIDSMRNLSTIYFDKTGTLTTGIFHIAAVSPAPGHSAEGTVAAAAALDAESSHPLARAILDYSEKQDIAVPEAEDVKSVNHGICGVIKGKTAAAGSRRLMERQGISTPPPASPLTEICVAIDGRYIGAIYLEDTVKSDAAATVRELHSLGVSYVGILSGDRKETVARVAKEIGADGFEAELLPRDKQRVVASAERRNGDVAFVGDGINDAPAIAAADAGISMGTLGTDIAMETSDVVIAGDDLAKIPAAIRLSRKVRATVIATVVFALGVKALVMILGAFGIATLWAAVFADTGVTLIVVIYVLLARFRE